MPDSLHTLEEAITADVRRALDEDVGTGDLTAALLPEGKVVRARLITRQDAVLCGTEWFNRTLEALDPDAEVFWHHADRSSRPSAPPSTSCSCSPPWPPARAPS